MKKILIGSRAAHHWFGEYRKADDWDWIVDWSHEGKNAWFERIDGERHEFHNGEHNKGNQYILDNTDGDIAVPEHLYTLKVCTMLFPVHWEKTAYDVRFFQSKEIKIDESLFNILYPELERIHGRKRANLKKTNEVFFKDNVRRKYVHDDIHEAVAYYNRPLYTGLKKNPELAYINQDLFEALDYQDKLRLCREEIYVTALERFLIPENFRMPKRTAYIHAAKQLLTTMTKGWFPKFIVLNWSELYKPDEHDFVGLFKERFNYETKDNYQKD